MEVSYAKYNDVVVVVVVVIVVGMVVGAVAVVDHADEAKFDVLVEYALKRHVQEKKEHHILLHRQIFS
uniref:Transmembrane protein n=1 Tax=Meloidogyne incognita TaxID=6306 RepID=A0A914N7N2_MELIC